MKKITSLFVATVMLFFSCKKEPSPTSGSISGNLTTYESANPLALTPVKDIKLYLINAGFKFDTVTYTGNRAAIVDSTVSDTQGHYRFSNIPFGKYYVSPLPDTAGYKFEPVAPGNANPLQLSEATPDHSLSFSSPMPGGENDEFTVQITIVNIPPGYSYYYIWTRQEFILFIPLFRLIKDSNGNIIHFNGNNSQNFEYGYYEVFCGTTNNFLLDFYNLSNQYVESYWITQDLGNTPPLSKWTIDLTAHTIVRTYP